ncbi:hypothetical protein ACFQZV_07295 [Microbacterium koreense]|uniref:Uncharacterized protein n=1 Tax=Microbacterium koreense TaxID=323761 RepID=A0ABW2ZR34_9MICO
MSARKPWTVEADYPGKKTLTEAEATSHLRHGPKLAWFMPWLRETPLRFLGMRKRGGYGYAHVSGGSEGPYKIDVRTFWDEEGLRWGLDTLHGLRGHCTDDCDGLYYWTPDTVVSGPVIRP